MQLHSKQLCCESIGQHNLDYKAVAMVWNYIDGVDQLKNEKWAICVWPFRGTDIQYTLKTTKRKKKKEQHTWITCISA